MGRAVWALNPLERRVGGVRVSFGILINRYPGRICERSGCSKRASLGAHMAGDFWMRRFKVAVVLSREQQNLVAVCGRIGVSKPWRALVIDS